MSQKTAGDHTIFNRPPQLHGLGVRADPVKMCAVGLTTTLKPDSVHFPFLRVSGVNACVSVQPVTGLFRNVHFCFFCLQPFSQRVCENTLL